MRVIGVLDLAGGRAVHAKAGPRALYRPVEAVAGSDIEPGDAVALACGYRDHLGVAELYAADLDSILHRGSQDLLITRLTSLGVPLWLDAGVSSVEAARHAFDIGATHVVVGLETLPNLDVLEEICREVGGNRVAFSLDLRNGRPMVSPSARIPIPPGDSFHFLTTRAVEAGVGSVIVIDVGRVGTGQGPDFGLIGRVRDITAGRRLVAGGGVRGPEDLAQLAATGCDRALVATALQSGQLDRTGIAGAGLGH